MIPDGISREIVIDAAPPVVWAIVTEPRHVARWFSDEAQIDLRPGGAMLLTWHGHGTYRGRVEAVRPDGESDLTAGAGCLDESGALEDGEVLGDALAGDRQVAGEGARGGVAAREDAVQHVLARGVGDRGP